MNALATFPPTTDLLPVEPSPALAEMTSFPRERQAAFLSALVECGSARRAARAAGVSHQTVYRARRACAAFRRGWDAALIQARAYAEDVLATRALDGVEEEVFYRGELIATRRRYDSRLLLAHLARLDKLTGAGSADARSAAPGAEAFAEDFEGSLERFVAGSDTPEENPAAAVDHQEPGQCNTRSTPPGYEGGDDDEDGDRYAGEAEASGLEWCPHVEAMVPAMDRVLNAMEAQRPEGAKTPSQIFGHGGAAEVEAEKIAAFEAGVARWWLVVPRKVDGDHDESAYLEGAQDGGASAKVGAM
jgi:hypothetical protein